MKFLEANGREFGRDGPFHFGHHGRFIDRCQPSLSFSATICCLFAFISRLRSFICAAISAAATFAQQTRPTTVTDRHTPTTFYFPIIQAFKRFLCLEHRTRGGILLTNPAFVSDPFQGTTERSGCPETSKMESHPPHMHVTAFCIVHACVFSPVAVTCISPKWRTQQPSPNHRKHCFML